MLDESIRRALNAKAGHYGKPDLPFVVAVLPMGKDRWGADHEDIMNALFGTGGEVYQLTSTEELVSHRFQRQRNGVWNGFDGVRNTRLSACLVAFRLFPWSVPRSSLSLYHHPLAELPHRSVLCSLPQWIPGDRRLEHVEGAALSDIFGLPLDWPGEREPGDDTTEAANGGTAD